MNKINYLEQLKQDYKHWEEVYHNGTSDPYWQDGLNLNLIRNHILYDKRMLKEELSEEQLPELYFKETPPEKDIQYMARKEEILQNAVEYYKKCIQTEGWNELNNADDFYDENDSEQKSMRFLVSRIRGLKTSIECLNYVEMRRFKDPSEDIEEIKKLAQRLEEINLSGMEQLSLFQM